MAQTHYKTLFRKVLLGFISEQDPVLAMLEWVAQMMMEIEAESRVGAEKGKHTKRPEDILLRSQGPAHGHAVGDVIPVHPQTAQRGLYPVLYHGEETVGAGADDCSWGVELRQPGDPGDRTDV